MAVSRKALVLSFEIPDAISEEALHTLGHKVIEFIVSQGISCEWVDTQKVTYKRIVERESSLE